MYFVLPQERPDPTRAAKIALRNALAAVLKRDGYTADPVLYAEQELGITFWKKQAEVARLLTNPPHRVLLKTANGVGKTALAGALAAWFYDTHDPGVCEITAPKLDQIKDTTFKELRRHLRGRPGLYPKNPRIESNPNHYITGKTANDATSFQGIHDSSVFLIFEEATGIDPEFWEAGRSILIGEKSYWLAIYNPTDPSSHVYAEETAGNWSLVTISAFEHPNILAEIGGEAAPIPNAVRLGSLKQNMVSEGWGQWVSEIEVKPTDVDTWDPQLYGAQEFTASQESGVRVHFPNRFWRPGAIGEARILARYPSQAIYSVYSDAGFDLAERSRRQPTGHIRFGCDVARFGDDLSSIVGQRGGVVVHHESYNGQDTEHTAGRLIELARNWSNLCECAPRDIEILVDDTGVGGGVTDKLRAFRFKVIPVNNEQKPADPDRYPNARSEIHFNLADRFAEGRVSLAGLSEGSRRELRRQAMGITYRLDGLGRRVAESKASTKKRLKCSPDDLDALGLSFYYPRVEEETVIPRSGGFRERLPGAYRT